VLVLIQIGELVAGVVLKEHDPRARLAVVHKSHSPVSRLDLRPLRRRGVDVSHQRLEHGTLYFRHD